MRVPPEAVGRLWRELGPWIEQGIQAVPCVWSMPLVKQRLDGGSLQLWGLRRDGETIGALVTEVYDTTAGRTVCVQIAGGSLAECWHCIEAVHEWGREQGCVRAEIVGRPGFERVMKPEGYSKIAVLIERRLN